MNLCAVLGIARDADDEAIRSAYRILARRYHPDRGAGSRPEKFRQVSEAYETLTLASTKAFVLWLKSLDDLFLDSDW